MGSELFLFDISKPSRAANEEKVTVPKLWGVRKTDLKRMNYYAAEDAFYGVHNIDPRIQVLDLMNPDEIVAIYVGTGRLKRNNGHYGLSLPADFGQLIKLLNREAFPTISGFVNSCNRHFDRGPGKQAKRLGRVSDEAKKAFIASFHGPYRPSDREQEYDGLFHDPNIDGYSRRAYTDGFYNKLKAEWSKRTG